VEQQCEESLVSGAIAQGLKPLVGRHSAGVTFPQLQPAPLEKHLMLSHMPRPYGRVRFGEQGGKHLPASAPEHDRVLDRRDAGACVPGGGGHEQSDSVSTLHPERPVAFLPHHAVRNVKDQTNCKAQTRAGIVNNGRLFGPVMRDDMRGRPAFQPRNALVLVGPLAWMGTSQLELQVQFRGPPRPQVHHEGAVRDGNKRFPFVQAFAHLVTDRRHALEEI
jgi:hypothetical protein